MQVSLAKKLSFLRRIFSIKRLKRAGINVRSIAGGVEGEVAPIQSKITPKEIETQRGIAIERILRRLSPKQEIETGGGRGGAASGRLSSPKPTPEELYHAKQAALAKDSEKIFQIIEDKTVQYDNEGTEIFLRQGDLFSKEVKKTGRPLGFKKIGGVDEFREFKDRLLGTIPPRYSEARIGIRGSSIHGNKHQRGTNIHDGPFFDTGKKLSDRDLFIVSPKLARDARRLGILKEGEKFTPLEARELKLLGLDRLADLMGRTGSRTISIRLYDSQKTLTRDGSYMTFKWGK